jgi:predicted dehydrogenase/threonine dehydrogenase-like Zn-dependent dehydrogenase
MRQVLISNTSAIVARMPRPMAEPGSVLVRVRYSLVSTGTELAALRPLSAGTAGVSAAERVSDLSSKAQLYLGKAARDPRKAMRRLSDIVKLAVARRMPERKPTPVGPPVPMGQVRWERQAARRCEQSGNVLSIVTDESDASYQAASQAFRVPEGYAVEVRLKGMLEAGAVSIGLLNHDKSSWLGMYRLDEGQIEETLHFDPAGSPEVTLMITNAGTRVENRLRLDSAEVTMLPPDASGLPVSEMIDQGWNVGYSAAGEVVAVGSGIDDLVPGDLVACAGAGQANHADYVSVKRNLVCRIPKGCPIDLAATTTVGTIALQGVRRAAPQVGETVCVLGLGLIGMITVQLLRASGCRVLGLDLDASRVQRAKAVGACAATTDAKEFERLVRDLTGGHGADQTIITAATKSNALINQSMEVTRRKGRVVIVGDVGLKAERATFYRKEIDLLMSTSYGPGRYDREYEEEGRDYPYAYVRWTSNRNMRAYMDLIAEGRIDVKSLIDRIAPVDQAPAVYKELAAGGGSPPLAVLFAYPDDVRPLPEPPEATRITLRGHRTPRAGALQYALVGAGAFGTSMLVPQMERRKDRFFLRGVVSRDTVRGGNFARSRQVAVVTTDLRDILSDPAFDLVVISTRHDDHAEQTIAALEAGKHVFVEKPLALTWEQLDAVRRCYQKLDSPPLLMVGFNRRFSPALQALRAALEGRTSPLVVNYRLNAGYIPPDHWVHGPQGGGRNIGEACHMYDVFRSLAGAGVRSVSATAIDPTELPYRRNDNFVATIGYADGTVATLTYTALGPREGLPKERIEVFCDGEAYIVDDFKSLTRCSDGQVLWSGTQDKGHFEELSRFGDAIAEGGPAPIPFEEILETTAVSLQVEDLLFGRAE